VSARPELFDQDAYDWRGNPRGLLEDLDQIEKEVLEEERAGLDQQLQALYETQHVFHSDGWQHIVATLQKTAEALRRQLLEGASHDPMKDAYARGDLKRIEIFLAWPERVSAGIESIKAEMDESEEPA
jgi:hypothetical protein